MTPSDGIALAAEATELAYTVQSVGNGFAVLPGFTVEHVFDDFWKTTGFYAVGFSSPDQTIVTIRGSQDRNDIIADADLGIPQHRRYRVPVLDYVGANLLGGRVTLVGHSLGGGLAQYLGYEAALEFPSLRDRLAIHTHNALGGVAGLTRLHGRYDPAAIEGVTVRNYRHPADVVSRIGGQVGGSVFDLVVPNRPVSPFLAHSNDHFLPHKSPGALAAAVAAHDHAFALEESLDRLTPLLARSVSEILDPSQRMAGLRRLMQLVMRMPADERRVLGGAISEFLPLKPVWKRLFSRPQVKAADEHSFGGMS